MADGSEIEQARRGRSRVAVAGGVAGAVALVALAAAWIERDPIVAHFVDRELAARDVPAAYRIAAIGPFSQRLEDVRLGDPRAPDLTARAIEVTLGYDRHGPHLVGLRAEGVRLAARLIDGRVSLGALDRLMPASSGGPVTLPAIDMTVNGARMTLATPAGTVIAALSGSGRLSDGFAGRLQARSDGLGLNGCSVAAPRADLRVRIRTGRPRIEGPLALAGVACAGVVAGPGAARLAMTFGKALDRWEGAIGLDGFAGRAPGGRFGALGGSVTVAGDTHRIAGDVRLSAAGAAVSAVSGGVTADRLVANGRYRYAAASGLVYAGDVGLGGAALSPALRQAILRDAGRLVGTPLGPVAVRAGTALADLLARADATATVALTAGGPAGTAAKLHRLLLTGANGATVRVDEGAGIGRAVRDDGWRVDGHLTTGGGALPTIDATLRQARAGAPVTGVARLAPYQAPGARLALSPVRFTVDRRGATRVDGVATLDGPLAGGRIAGLTVPLAGSVDARGVTFGAGCLPVSFQALSMSGITLTPAALRICGIGGAPIFASGGGTVRAGAQIAGLSLHGRSGEAPLTLAAQSLRITTAGLAGSGIGVRLGAGEAATRLDLGTLDARFGSVVTGHYADAGGQIANVPLLLSAGAGDWRVTDGALELTGTLALADAAATPRFKPVTGRDVALRLAGGRITASGTMHEPTTGARLAEVTLVHDLATGRGGATLAVPALTFDKRLQPELLTPVTLGVIANVNGTLSGAGRIDWDGRGVTSTGDFATDRIDLAAAFGPVTGIAGKIHFSDLLGLVTPPHQQATIADINPGIAVDAGVVHYQLLAGQRVAVEDARWPFAGGTLSLDPSVLAFDQDSERHLTFRLDRLDAAAFVQQLAFPNLAATGIFDGTLPMVFDQKGGRIDGGTIVARAPGGTVAYVGRLSNEKLGTMGKLAFDALKAIRYSSLSIGLDGRLDGEIVSHVAFQGVRQATPDASYIARLIHNLPFRFNIAVRAPFRSLLGTARSYVDPSLLLAGGLPTPGDVVAVPPAPSTPTPAAIQPAESDPVR